ncbi:hypothetical protein LP420_28740 [Massilia sp. B-10]|nr:hypothetical protein LP420_28740 [Massilia sp. B-10]
MVGISQVKEMRIHLARQELAVYKAMNARGRVGRDEAMGQLDLARLQLQAALEASRPTLYLAENLERLREFESRLARINRISEEALTLSRNQDQETAQALIDNDSFPPAGRGSRPVSGRYRIAQGSDGARNADPLRARGRPQELADLRSARRRPGAGAAAVLADQPFDPPAHPARAQRGRRAGHAYCLNQVIPHTDFKNETGDLARAIALLQVESRQLETQRWVKSQEAAMQAELQQLGTPYEAAQRFLSLVAPLLKA